MQITFFDIFSFFTIFQLLIFVLFLFHKGRTSIANNWLSVFFIAQALAYLNAIISMSQYAYFFEHAHYLINIGVAFQLVWGPAYFFYIKALLTKNQQFEKKHLVHFIPALVVFVFMLINYQLASKEHIIGLQTYDSVIFKIISYTLISQLITYNILTIRILYLNKSEIKTENPATYFWAKFFVYSYLFGCLYTILSSLLSSIVATQALNTFSRVSSHLYFFVFFNVVFYKALLKPEIFHGTTLVKYAQTGLSQKQISDYYKQIMQFVINDKPFLEPGISLKKFAATLNIQPRHVSQVINICEKCNFSDFINKQRIEEAKKALESKTHSDKTILEILYSVGFNSKTSFNTAFKKQTGVTPIAYRKGKR